MDAYASIYLRKKKPMANNSVSEGARKLAEARSKKLTAERRSEIAKKAALARWTKEKKQG